MIITSLDVSKSHGFEEMDLCCICLVLCYDLAVRWLETDWNGHTMADSAHSASALGLVSPRDVFLQLDHDFKCRGHCHEGA